MKKLFITVLSVLLTLSIAACGKAAYTLSYDGNGGELTETSRTGVSSIPKELPTPVRSGYTFTGWFYDSEATKAAVSGDRLQGDTTLYAGWTADPQQQMLGPAETMTASVFSDVNLPFLIGTVVLAGAAVALLVRMKKKKGQ